MSEQAGEPPEHAPTSRTERSGAAGAPRRAPWEALRRWLPDLAIFVALLALFTTWVVAIPRFASPDEPGHVFKAYGTAHGQLLGDAVVTDPPTPSNLRVFDGPAELGSGDLRCFVYLGDEPAGCEGPGSGYLLSTAATYPPFYYAAVGGVARVVGQPSSVRTFRLASAMFCALSLAGACALLRRSRARRLTPLVMAALTPMAMFMAASVNPNGFEIAGFVLLWALLLRICTDDDVDHRLALAIGATAGVLVLCRPIAAAWLVGVAVVVLIAVDPARRRRLLRRPVLARVLIPLAISALGSYAWLRYASFELADSAVAGLSMAESAKQSVERWPEYYLQTIGVLGWLDTRMPWFIYVGWSLALIAVAAVACRRSDARRWIALGALVAAWLAMPLAINATTAGTGALSFQGRYSLPLLPGLLFLAMLDRPSIDRSRLFRPVVPAVLMLVAVAEVGAFWQTLRRFAVGSDGKIWLVGDLPWRPAVAPMPLIVINAIVMAAACVAVALVARRPRSATDEHPDPISR